MGSKGDRASEILYSFLTTEGYKRVETNVNIHRSSLSGTQAQIKHIHTTPAGQVATRPQTFSQHGATTIYNVKTHLTNLVAI